MPEKKLNPCTESIIKTLSYSGVFNYPLTSGQIFTNLISKNRFGVKQFKKELKKLVNNGLVTQNDGRFYLSEIEPINIDKRKSETKLTLKRKDKTLHMLEKIPWIKMIAVTGSAANYNKEEGSDTDLLFVTMKNRVWLTRGLVFLILKLTNNLSTKHEEREICPNIFMDERYSAWKKSKRNIYIAQNIISMQPFFDRDETYFRFMQSNRWVKNYYVNFNIAYPQVFEKPESSNSFVLDFVNKLAMKAQFWYMRTKITTETIKNEFIHFNKNDNSKRILTKYKILLKRTKKKFFQYPKSSA